MTGHETENHRRRHLLHDPDNPTVGLCATAHLEVMVHGDCRLVRSPNDVTCDECKEADHG